MLINKITIGGEYWDSYIYSNGLMLFARDHSIKSYKWDQIIGLIINNNKLDKLAFKCAFLNSEYLYGFSEKRLFDDPEIRTVMINKFKNNSNKYYLNLADLEQFKHYRKAVELFELPYDLGVYKNVLYYCNSNGIFSRNLRKNNDNLVSSKEIKHSDCPVQCLRIGNSGRIALAASSDGLMEMDVNRPFFEGFGFQHVEDNIVQISTDHSSYCNWSFSSILSGSYSDRTSLYGFNYEKVRNNFLPDEHNELRYQGAFDEQNMFDEAELDSIIFSGNEKIYRITNDKIEVLNFIQKNIKSDDSPFNYLHSEMLNIENDIVCAEVAEFGVVIETKNNLYVVSSNGEMQQINSNPNDKVVNWRVFPRSTSYVNQLHVIYEDRLEILSINDDYFINPDDKIFGQRFRKRLLRF